MQEMIKHYSESDHLHLTGDYLRSLDTQLDLTAIRVQLVEKSILPNETSPQGVLWFDGLA